MPQHVPSAQLAGMAERRQVTALAYDLVGSTRLAERLDPEDMHELLRGFHRMCTAAIEEFGGKVNRYIGDGGMAYFGYPITYENAAERAIQAGLAITERCARLGTPGNNELGHGEKISLSVRVGIATSKVVAGDMTGEKGFGVDEVVGIAPHLAARLQAAAGPNSILVSDATRRLVGTLFRFGRVHELELPGFSLLQQAWTVLHSRPLRTRFEGLHSLTNMPVLGRDEEIGTIFDRWQRAQNGQGQVVLLTGDPGIGKSRVVAEIRRRLAQDAAMVLSLQCSPLHVSTPLHPIRSSLERALLMRSDKPHHLPQGRLGRLLDLPVPSMPDAAPVVMDILFPLRVQARPSESAEQIKEEVFSRLIAFVAGLSARSPLLVIIEDVHWIDPSTLELVERLMAKMADLPILLIATARPTFKGFSSPFSNLSTIDLVPLPEQVATSLVQSIAGASRLPAAELQRIVARSEGNPFFLEELTRAFLERSIQEGGESGISEGELPISLMDALAARLDQSGPGKPIAQVASAIGRNFPHTILQQATELAEEALEAGLARLYELGVIAPEHGVPQRSYRFRHALLQQSAYDSMVKATRQATHQRLAAVLEEASAEPEILARHLIESGQNREAIVQLRLAGQRASLRSASQEAVSLLQHALTLCSKLEPDAERTELELDICLALGPLLISTTGPGADAVQDIYSRAIALSDGVPTDQRRFTAYWGWWRTSPNFKDMRERADRLSSVTSALSNPHLALQAHHCQWATLFMLGEQKRCCEHVRDGLAFYDAAQNRHDAILYGGHDPKICGLGEEALSLWLQGFSNRSYAVMKACARHAATLDHLASKTHFEEAEINLLHFRRDVAAVQERAARMLQFAENLGFRDISAKAEIFGGWAAALSGRLDEGIASIERGLAAQRVIGTQEDFPAYLEMLAEAYGLAGKYSRGLEAIEEAIGIANETGLRYWIAEILRRKGELLASLGQVEEAIRCYDEAIAAADMQGAYALLLRAAISKAEVVKDMRSKSGVIEDLEGALAKIPEASPTPDTILTLELLKRLREAP
jgi:predicted ATPase/class 3 adenylate cyclase